jgi:hypothetical protein
MILMMLLLAFGFKRRGATGLAAATARGSFIIRIVLPKIYFRLQAGEVFVADFLKESY